MKYLIIVLVILGIQFLIILVLELLIFLIKRNIPTITQEAVQLSKDYKCSSEDYKKEVFNFHLAQNSSYYSTIVGIVESILFIIITHVLLTVNQGNLSSTILGIIPIMGGWFALKIFGNYQNWSGAILGRAIFYNFLLGTMLNLSLSFILGYLLYIKW